MTVPATRNCPHCGGPVQRYRNPVPTVDIIIEIDDGILLVYRKNEPVGWAIPGGFVDYGESLEEAARREAREETSLDVTDLRQMGSYSNPDRDPRLHTISTVFIARATGTPEADDDAARIGLFTRDSLPEPIVFDHGTILSDYFRTKKASG